MSKYEETVKQVVLFGSLSIQNQPLESVLKKCVLQVFRKSLKIISVEVQLSVNIQAKSLQLYYK